jgi:hypothetical protein
MSAIVSTTDIAPGVTKTVIHRTRRTVIEATPEGRYTLTAEREEVTLINDQIVGAPLNLPPVILNHEDIVANSVFGVVQAAISQAIEAKAALPAAP